MRCQLSKLKRWPQVQVRTDFNWCQTSPRTSGKKCFNFLNLSLQVKPKQTYWNSKLILIDNWSRLSRMRRGEWSLLLLRLLSVSERMKGHSDMIKLVYIVYLFLSQSRVNQFWSRLPKKNGSFFLKKLQSWICLWRTRIRVNRTCQSIDMSEYCFKRSAFLTWKSKYFDK